MATEVVMPALEMAQETGTLVRWLKAEGEFTRQGEPLMEIETDKITIEIEAPASGILANITAAPGTEVPVGQAIALLLAEHEAAAAPAAAPQPAGAPKQRATPVAKRLAAAHGLDIQQVSPNGGRTQKADVLNYLQALESAGSPAVRSRLTPASPKARLRARQEGIDLAALTGSGPSDAVVMVDIDQALAARARAAQVEAPPEAPHPAYTVTPLSGMRKVIAERLQSSYQTAPHIAVTRSADMTETLRLVDKIRPAIAAEHQVRLGVTAVLISVIARSLLKHPRLNAHLVGDEIRAFSTVNMGVAVALDDGLIVPVIHGVERKCLGTIQSELQDLSERARAGSLRLPEIKGSSFTLSNLGMFGAEHFTAILNPPEVGILAIGAIQDTPVGVDGQLVLRPMLHMTLSADHRAVDGATAARFLQTLKELLENPYLLLA